MSNNLEKKTNEESNFNLKLFIVVCIGVIALYFVVRFGYSCYLDQKVNNTLSVVEDESDVVVNPIDSIVAITINGDAYSLDTALQDKLLSSGDIVDITVKRQDESVDTVNAYIVTAPNGAEFSYEETLSYVKLIIPKEDLN